MPSQYVMPGTMPPHQEAAVTYKLVRRDLKIAKVKRKAAEQRACSTIDKEIEGLNRQLREAEERLIPFVEDKGAEPTLVAMPAEYDDKAVRERGKQTMLLFEVQETVKNHSKRVEIEDDPDPIVKKKLKLTEHLARAQAHFDDADSAPVTEEPPPWDGTPAGPGIAEPVTEGEFAALPEAHPETIEAPDCGRKGCGDRKVDHAGMDRNGLCTRPGCKCLGYQAPGPAV